MKFYLILLLFLGYISSVYSASSSIVSGSTYRIIPTHSQKCLEVEASYDGSTGVAIVDNFEGSSIQQGDCRNTSNQDFIIKVDNNGYYQLKPEHSNRCISSACNISSSYLQECFCDANNDDQLFKFLTEDDDYKIIPKINESDSPQKCLDIEASFINGIIQGGSNGDKLQKYDCANPLTSNQIFTVSLAQPKIISPILGPLLDFSILTLTPILKWESVPGATSYRVQMVTQSEWFANGFATANDGFDCNNCLVNEKVVDSTEYKVVSGILNNSENYYWRVRAGSSSIVASGWSIKADFRIDLVGKVVLNINPNTGLYDLGDDIRISWETINIPTNEGMIISIKRDSYTGNDPNDPNYHQFTTDTINDGNETFTVPLSNIFEGDDWRVYVRASSNNALGFSNTFSIARDPSLNPSVSNVSVNQGLYLFEDMIEITWNTTDISPSENMVISIKRESYSGDDLSNNNYHRFTTTPSFTVNNGKVEFTIPMKDISEGNDWRVYVRASSISNTVSSANDNIVVARDPSIRGSYLNNNFNVNEALGLVLNDYTIDDAVAKVYYPISSIQQKMPIVLFIHGQNHPCEYPEDYDINDKVYPCPNNISEVFNHNGYNYLLDHLSSHGFFTISISANETNINGLKNGTDINDRGELILAFLDIIRSWNNGSGTHPEFKDRIDLSKIILSGHSRGGEGVVAATELNNKRNSKSNISGYIDKHAISAIVAIAPTDKDENSNVRIFHVPEIPYFLLIGSRDGDVNRLDGFKTYDRTRSDKMIAWVYGANHNYFNEIWEKEEDDGEHIKIQGEQNGFSGILFYPVKLNDENSKLKATEQKKITKTTITAFSRKYLFDINYDDIFLGLYKYIDIDTNENDVFNEKTYFTFQNKDNLILSDFENTPINITTLPATNETNAELTLLNDDIKNSKSSINQLNIKENKNIQFFHDTNGAVFTWSEKDSRLIFNVPEGKNNFSKYNKIMFRISQIIPVSANLQNGIALSTFVTLVDDKSQKMTVDTLKIKNGKIPYPYQRSINYTPNYIKNQSQMTSITIPFIEFVRETNFINLSSIKKVIISFSTNSGSIGIDDISLGN